MAVRIFQIYLSRGFSAHLNYQKGKRAAINVVLEDSLHCALGVSAYAN